MTPDLCIVWLRNDLRLTDNPALASAARSGARVLPLYIREDDPTDPWPEGGAARVWRHHSLARLDVALRSLGSRLILRHGDALAVLRSLVAHTGAGRICWNRRYEPAAIARDRAIMAQLRAEGLEVSSFPGNLLFEPWEVANKSGRPFQVFTRFWQHCATLPAPMPPEPAPVCLPAPAVWPAGDALEALGLLPDRPWAASMIARWQPGAEGADRALGEFLAHRLQGYADGRDLPAQPATSRLSPHLHFGEIGVRQVWQALNAQAVPTDPADDALRRFRAEIGWREFAHHLLFHFPHTTDAPLRKEFAAFPWREPSVEFVAWKCGRTGYPLVDAGMRELWQTGFMHNRVRMVAASFLVKHLRIDWRHGARWFWDTLVDADLASNTLGWQWSAGCGADAAPYFRIFNPVLQGEKFDPEGIYVRRYVPELARLPSQCVHHPWDGTTDRLGAAGVRLGADYPFPVVDHARARGEALAAFQRLRGTLPAD